MMADVQTKKSTGNGDKKPRPHLPPEAAARVRAELDRLLARAGNKEEFYRKLGVSQPAVWKIARGGGVSLRTARKVAEFSGMRLEALLGEESVLPASLGYDASRFVNLEKCLAYENRWSPATVAAARAGAFPDDAPTPRAWAPRLDRLDLLLLHASSEQSQEKPTKR